MKKTAYIDMDGCVFDTISTIVGLYNEDHLYYKDFKTINASDVKTWDFLELDLEPPEFIDRYFNMPRFFKEDNLKLINCAKWIINRLHYFDGYEIIFCSAGSYSNLSLKRKWIQKHFEYAGFVPVDLSIYKDKSHIKMDDCFFIDDVAANLETSSAEVPICFGKKYPWNENYGGIRCETWVEVYEFIKKEEEKRR